MEYVVLRNENHICYVEKRTTEAIVMNPIVQAVPDAKQELLGLSLYKGRLIAYYRLGESERYSCGVILKSQGRKNMMSGIAAMEASLEDMDEELLTEVFPGVWEYKGD